MLNILIPDANSKFISLSINMNCHLSSNSYLIMLILWRCQPHVVWPNVMIFERLPPSSLVHANCAHIRFLFVSPRVLSKLVVLVVYIVLFTTKIWLRLTLATLPLWAPTTKRPNVSADASVHYKPGYVRVWHPIVHSYPF